MKIIKILTICVLLLSVSEAGHAMKRPKPTPMSELTDPSSPSYVPCPYPKNRKEIIIDLLYAFKKLHTPREGYYLAGREPEFINYFRNMLKKNSDYKVGEILKIKDRYGYNPHEFFFQILIEDKLGRNVAVADMDESGIYTESSNISPHREKDLLIPKEVVLKILEESIGKKIDQKHIKSMDRVSYGCSIAGNLCPAWEIVLQDGSVYYYSICHEMVFGIKEKKKRKKTKTGLLKSWRYFVEPGNDDFLVDDLNEQIILLKRFKRKK